MRRGTERRKVATPRVSVIIVHPDCWWSQRGYTGRLLGPAWSARLSEGPDNWRALVEATDFKAGWRWLWEQGDYRPVGERTMPAAEELVAAAGVQPSQRVLEVGAGVGNAARVAARLGAVVTASDFAAPMVEAGRELSATEGLTVEWLEADIEDLPLPDGSFDVVLSTFGIDRKS